MDIIVTTPKSQTKAAAQEAADCIADGGGEYFRRFDRPLPVWSGDRVYYVERGYVRGFCVVSRVDRRVFAKRCETTGRIWPLGFYIIMDATTWQWIRPIRMRGFQGWRRADGRISRSQIEILGDWLDPMPSPVSPSFRPGPLFRAGDQR